MIGTSFLLILFLGSFIRSIAKSEINLQKYYDTLEVKMVIRRRDGASNLNLPREMLRELEQSGYFKDYIYSEAFEYDSSLSHGEESPNLEDNLRVWLLPSAENGENVQFTLSYIVGDQSLKLSYGECIGGYPFQPSKETDQVLVKIYQGPKDAQEDQRGILMELKSVGQNDRNNLYLNYEQFKEICGKLEIPSTIQTAEFIIKDTRNITELYRDLSEVSLFQKNPLEFNVEYTYEIFDGVLNESTAPLIRTIKILNSIFPFMFVFVTGIGFLLSYVTGRLEARNLFLMKSMGTPSAFRFLSIFVKQTIYSVMGALLGLAFLSIGYVAIYLCSYLIGCAVSVIRILHMRYHEVGRE
jgi:hypothetical protein